MGDLFDIKGIKQAKSQGLIPTVNSGIPYVVQSISNNMVSRNVDKQWLIDNDEPPIHGNVLVLGVTLPAVSYQPYEFGASQVITARADFLTEEISLYFVVLLKKQMLRFSYSHKPGINIYKNTIVSLPITPIGEIDFAFMESRIREMEESRIREMEAYLKVAGFEDCELTEEERSSIELMKQGNVVFNSFYVTDDHKKKRRNGVFAVKNSHNILQSSVVVGSGNIPYVTAGEGNNSVYAYISYDRNQIEEGNAIMIGGKTMVVTYQADDFFSNDSHNLVLYVKDKRLRKELIQLFMVASLNKSLKPIYSWGDSISKTKIVKDKINLPVTSSGSIDYKFMETYIRAIEKLTIQRVKDWRAKEIKTTMDIVKDDDTEKSSLQPSFGSKHYEMQEEDVSMMVADNIFIPYSVEVRLWNTKREDLFEGILDLLLMYAIGPSARHKTESACKIALGIKETNLSVEAIKAFKSVHYIMFHYWKNSVATPFELTAPVRLVEKESIPEGFLIRQEKDAKQYLLIEYNSDKPAELGEYDILRAQRRGCNRYVPFVCRVENIKVDKND